MLEQAYPDAEVIYARNVTDVDDKIMASAAAEGVEVGVITDRFERFYLEDMGALGVDPPTIAPHATQEIAPMIAMIETLIAKGHAYEADGHVLFAVAERSRIWRFVAARPRRDDRRGPGRSRALQARPGRFRAVETERCGVRSAGTARGAAGGPVGTSNVRR